MSKKGLLGIALAAILLLIIAAVSLSVWIKNYLRSDDFRALVAARTGDALKIDATYTPFRWAGPSVFADTLTASGREDGIINSLQADQIRAEINWRAVMDGAWRVDRIDIVNLSGEFHPGTTGKSMAQGGEKYGTEGGVKGGDVLQGGTGKSMAKNPPFSQWLPRRFELGQLNAQSTRLTFLGHAPGEKIATLDNTALRLRPDGSGWAIEGNRGTLNVLNQPTLNVVSFRSRLQGSTFFLTDSQFQLGNGKISASGEFSSASKLRAEWTQVDVAQFLDATWKSRLSGLIAGSAELDWPESGPAAGKASGHFVLTEGLVQNVQTLEQIATFTGAPQFRRMPLQEFSANYLWQAGNITLTNIVAESKGLLRVEGTCSIGADDSVQGTLRVGVTPQTLQWLPGSRERVFTTAQNGYLWTDVRLAGTTQNLKEDLSSRLANAMKDQVIQEGTKALDVLPGPAREGAKGVLDMLTPLIP